uniref:RecQ mediated genome instability protein 1 OB-fold domain-containing protein n=1 Tax=Salix viminalis TaxID=40686 RepID=A0A6N2N4Q6_SALVM
MDRLAESSSKAAEAVLEILRTRGWSLGDIDQLNALIIIHSALSDDGDPCTVANSVESELLNMDLRSIGFKSLPDPNLLNKTSYLQGPKILQISAVRDISVSSIEGFSNSSNRRLLKLRLTDGHNEITAIEYSHVPSIPNDIVPGSKVRLENKAPVHNCIVCLNPRVITVIGGIVQSLHEEWKMNQKYSGISRSSLRLSQETDNGGPPRFEKLQIRAPSRGSSQKAILLEKANIPDYSKSTSNSTVQISTETSGNSKVLPLDAQRKADSVDGKVRGASLRASYKENPRNFQWKSKEDYHGSSSKSNAPTVAKTSGNSEQRPMDSEQKVDDDKAKIVSLNESLEQKPNDSSARQKEVIETVPVQNQAASQKLLLKMNHRPNQGAWQPKSQKYRGKNKQEESQVFTLEEWEKSNAGPKRLTNNDLPDTSCDEDLASKLQYQLDVEDFQVHGRTHNTVVEDIRLSMFNYERDGNRVHEMEHGGRGRGGGRGRARARGRRRYS